MYVLTVKALSSDNEFNLTNTSNTIRIDQTGYVSDSSLEGVYNLIIESTGSFINTMNQSWQAVTYNCLNQQEIPIYGSMYMTINSTSNSVVTLLSVSRNSNAVQTLVNYFSSNSLISNYPVSTVSFYDQTVYSTKSSLLSSSSYAYQPINLGVSKI